MQPSFVKYSLPNGMQVLLKEIHTLPLISHWVWYRVGSRNEQPGQTGISHWVEHMQFKGTELFPAGVLDKAISRDGGYWNAMTYLDWTAYFETLPAERIRLALELESDRMINSLYDPKEVESERTVILSEMEGSKNDPLSRLSDAVQEKSFDLHPYRHEVIGSEEDLRSISRDDLYLFYRQHYSPNNAVLAIAGDFDTRQMMDMVAEYYGDIPSYNFQDPPIERDAPLQGERLVEMSGADETAYLQVAYRAPQANNRDFLALLLLDSILSGPSSLNLFSAGITNKTSRLYHRLVPTQQAVAVGGSVAATIDPYLYDITVTLHPNSDHDTALRSIDEEIERMQQELVPAEELARAVKQHRAMLAYGNENITNQAFWLGYSEVFGSYEHWYLPLMDTLDTITPQEVQRAARTLLRPDERVIGKFIPENKGGAA
jgi:zinc protease